MTNDTDTQGTHTYEQSATQSERATVLANDIAVASQRPINTGTWIAGGRTETADDIMQRRAEMVDRQHAQAIQGSQWINGARPEPSTYFEQSRQGLDDELGEGGRYQIHEPIYGQNLSAPNWGHDPAGLEPPLGIDVTELNPDQLANNINLLSRLEIDSVLPNNNGDVSPGEAG
jgi:hypothetical protein